MNKVYLFFISSFFCVTGCADKNQNKKDEVLPPSEKEVTNSTNLMSDSISSKLFSFIDSIKPLPTVAEIVYFVDGHEKRKGINDIQTYFILNESDYNTGAIRTEIINNTSDDLLLANGNFQWLKNREWVTIPRAENKVTLDTGIEIKSENTAKIFFFLPSNHDYLSGKYRLFITFTNRERNCIYYIYKEFLVRKN